ncbi:MAG TPA: serine/threonine-protein kinase, partial [Chroococcales cyanobacterium]
MAAQADEQPAAARTGAARSQGPRTLRYVQVSERKDPDRSNLHLGYKVDFQKIDFENESLFKRTAFKDLSGRDVKDAGERICKCELHSRPDLGDSSTFAEMKAEWIDADLLQKTYTVVRSEDASATRCFFQEIESVGRLDHPNIAAIYDHGISPDASAAPYIVMSNYPCVTLAEEIRAGQLANPLSIFIDICDAINHAHERNVIHGRLNCTKVLLVKIEGDLPLVKLIDFGITAALRDGSHLVKSQCSPFASPEELFYGWRDERSDIFALGCIMYEALTGRKPVNAGRNWQINRFVPAKNAPPYMIGLENIIMRCLQIHPVARYQTVSALLLDLQALAGSCTAAGYSWSLPTRRSHMTALLAFSAGLFTPVLIYALWHLIR